tara:strand:- start:2152 stop:3447 length:1296 start_codon:yes stop_codon:yes gene_type:complete
MSNIGEEIHNFAKELWPLNRSITGSGVRETLKQTQKILPNLKIHEVASGTQVFDWIVPKEWEVKEAWIKKPNGKKICDFSTNNLHLVGYSKPIHQKISKKELDKHLFSSPEQPSAIPYVTSYYKERWGFCISEFERKKLEDGDYEVFINSSLFNGSLTYGELVINGRLNDEIFISTYTCHPSMANNELSGLCVTTFLAKWVQDLKDLKYTYRIVFIPETIGSITYLSRNLNYLKKHVCAGFNVSCIGDNRAYSYLPSRQGNTISDKVAKHVLKFIDPNYKAYRWADRGSDERQYCAPKIDLPIASIMRTKYGQYDEYHTSLDDLVSVVTPEGLAGGFNALRRSIETLERNGYPTTTVFGEPQLGKRGLYPTLSKKNSASEIRLMMNLITWSDGKKSLLEIAELCDVAIWELYPFLDKLISHNILELNDTSK